jgi:PAS domain S-box-containing protein
MTDKDEKPQQAEELRVRAEQVAREITDASPESLTTLLPEETSRALHELQIHHIELEMQNEELRRAQAELELSRERYFDLYDLAPVGYCAISEQGLILEANLTAATLLGMARNALVKQPVRRFILNEDQDIYSLHSTQLFETGKPQECELRMVKLDGTLAWAHLAATVARDSDVARACRVVISDITERKKKEAELEFKNLVLFTQQETSIDGILLVDENNSIISCNRRFAELWDIPAELVEAGDDAPVLRLVTSKVADSEGFLARIKYLNEHQKEKSREEIHLVDGRVFDRYSAPMLGAEGKYYGRFWYLRDITQQKQMEEELKQHRDHLEGLVMELQRQKNIMAATNRIFHEAISCETDVEVASVFLEVATELTSTQFGLVSELNAEGTLDAVMLNKGAWDACDMPTEKAIRLLRHMEPHGYWGQVIGTGHGLLVNDPDSSPHRRGVPEGHVPILRFLGIPLLDNENIIGLIGLANKDSDYTENDRACVEALAPAFVEAMRRKRAEMERGRLLLELRDALEKVKTLRGLLPICSCCKKIRDDKGYWTQLEVYFKEHSDAEFSHGLCHECAEKMMKEFEEFKKLRGEDVQL